MARLNDLSEENIRNLVQKITDFNQGSAGSYQMPPGLLEALGIAPGNTTGGRKAGNIENEEANEVLRDVGPIRVGSSEKPSKKHFAILKEKARALASREKFYEASALLEDVDDNTPISDLGTKLLMVECYLQLGRENRANKCLKYIEKALTSAPLLPSDDLVELAKAYIKGSSHVRAITILNITTDIILRGSGTPDEKLSGVFRCYSKLDDLVTAMLIKGGRSRTIAADMGMESMQDLFDKIHGIKNCNRDQQLIKEGWCSRYLDHNYHLLGEHRKCVHLLNRALKNMEDHFTPEGARRHCIYGIMLHNLAVTLCNTKKFDEALAAMQRALEAKQLAIDYQTEEQKVKDIEESKKGLRQVRVAMAHM